MVSMQEYARVCTVVYQTENMGWCPRVNIYICDGFKEASVRWYAELLVYCVVFKRLYVCSIVAPSILFKRVYGR